MRKTNVFVIIHERLYVHNREIWDSMLSCYVLQDKPSSECVIKQASLQRHDFFIAMIQR
jgi:hypothetical protein